MKYLSNLLHVPLVVAEIFTTLLLSTTDNVVLLIISQLFTQFLLSLSSPLRVSSVRFWPVVCMQGMTTHFKTSKALKVRVRNLFGVSLDLCQAWCRFFIHWSCSTGQEGGGRECPGAQRRRVGGHVRTGAQPAPAWADQG